MAKEMYRDIMISPEPFPATVGTGVHNEFNHPLARVDEICARYRGHTPSFAVVIWRVKVLVMMPISCSPATVTGARSTIAGRTGTSGHRSVVEAMRGTGTSIPAMHRSTAIRMTSRTGYPLGACRTRYKERCVMHRSLYKERVRTV